MFVPVVNTLLVVHTVTVISDAYMAEPVQSD